ncbi:MAG: alanine dehydrogenase [Clostridiales bacterium]|nr:alanine dehydrogenase [Clostridiales bacterium]
MKIGCVKEIKPQEYRVGMTPGNVHDFVAHGHEVMVETGAGEGSGFSDAAYQAAGAAVVPDANNIWAECGMIVKVKEPLEAEYPLMREGQILYTYLHLAANKPLTEAMLQSGCIGIAYETIEDAGGGLPLLKPMSEIAGRLSIQEGAKYLEKPFGGKGVLLGGVPGVKGAKVIILGAGIVGANACKMAMGLSADVVVMDVDLDKLRTLDALYDNRIQTLFSTPSAIRNEVRSADLVVGAVLIHGASAPKLLKREYLREMIPGSVVVDVAVDQGGCFETTRPTYHHDPVYEVDGIIHYCVANMPGAVPRTSTLALTNATHGYGLKIAGLGVESLMEKDPLFRKGINIYRGACTYDKVAREFGLPCQSLA